MNIDKIFQASILIMFEILSINIEVRITDLKISLNVN